LRAESVSDSSIAILAEGIYDVIIAASSWDRRCIEISRATHLHGTTGILLLFDHKDTRGLREEHDRRLECFLREACTHFVPLHGDSVKLEQMWPGLLTEVIKLVPAHQGGLRVLMDLSCLPRYYSLGLLARGITDGFVHDLTILYAEGKYDFDVQPDDAKSFTFGAWRNQPIPSLEGEYDPGKKTHYIVCVGFEGTKTLRVLTRSEPDRVSIVFPSPGVWPGYENLTREKNKVLFERYKVPEDQIINVAAGDAIAVWKAMEAKPLERPEQENCRYLLCGTKPHCLGLALRALCLRYPTVLYNVPDEHCEVDIYPTGRYWRYDIRDLSAISPNL